jgi:hypothetical protein
VSDTAGAPDIPDIAALVEVFNRHQVSYVIIGGAAAQFYLAGVVTHDVDFTPATDADNLARLSAVLTELQARVRTHAVPEGLPFAHDAASLGRSKMWNLQCRYGAFDIAFEPAGGGYKHLSARARLVTVQGVDIPVADLADIVASKRLANRPKDQLVLPQLGSALAERDRAATSPTSSTPSGTTTPDVDPHRRSARRQKNDLGP